MPPSLTDQSNPDVIEILTRVDEGNGLDKPLLQQVSHPPKRFHLTALLVIVWGVLLLYFSTLLVAPLRDPVAWAQHRYEVLLYAFQVPMAVFVAGVLGKRYGTATILIYLLAGFAGLPVFAGGGGLNYLYQPSVGYLLGFLLIPWAIQTWLVKAYHGTGWFQGRSLWMGIGALLGVIVVHFSGLLGLAVHALAGNLTWPQAEQWMHLLSWPVLIYDFCFSWIAMAMVRLTRLALWVCLY